MRFLSVTLSALLIAVAVAEIPANVTLPNFGVVGTWRLDDDKVNPTISLSLSLSLCCSFSHLPKQSIQTPPQDALKLN